MNFAQMLMQDVKPLPPATAEGQRKAKVTRVKKNTWSDMTKARVVRCAETLEKYRKAVGPEWRSACSIAERAGMARASMFKQLEVYVAKGVLERRAAGGKAFNRRSGWEWRVVE